jgi:hypothetical protein
MYNLNLVFMYEATLILNFNPNFLFSHLFQG